MSLELEGFFKGRRQMAVVTREPTVFKAKLSRSCPPGFSESLEASPLLMKQSR